jgi:hypothetical protein
MLTEQPTRFLLGSSGDMGDFHLGLLFPSGKLGPLGEASERREKAGEHPIHPPCPRQIPREPPDLIESVLHYALFHSEPKESYAALPLVDVLSPLSHEVSDP